jgi:hypothetical protein
MISIREKLSGGEVNLREFGYLRLKDSIVDRTKGVLQGSFGSAARCAEGLRPSGKCLDGIRATPILGQSPETVNESWMEAGSKAARRGKLHKAAKPLPEKSRTPLASGPV